MLWIAQVLLASFFFMAGSMKAFQPMETLSAQLPIAAQVHEGFIRFIGIVELLGVVGLLLPSLLKIKPWLTPLAALGFAVVMLLAAVFHLSRGESPAVPMNIVLGLIALFTAWGRYKRPIYAKGSIMLN